MGEHSWRFTDDGQALDGFQDPVVLLERRLYVELIELLRQTFLNVTGLTRFRRTGKQLGHNLAQNSVRFEWDGSSYSGFHIAGCAIGFFGIDSKSS